jgi:sporulation protein YlmC with PRC-barrel domain
MTSPTTAPAHTLIESDRVEGTAVYDREGRHTGTIKRLMIDKVSGQVAYVVVAFAYLGLSDDSYVIPWGKLRYDTRLSNRRTADAHRPH